MFTDFVELMEAILSSRSEENEVEKKPTSSDKAFVTVTIDGKTYTGNTVSECFEKIKAKQKQKENKFVPKTFTDIKGNKFSIKEVKFSNPATIIFWTDNTKTVVKAIDGEHFDKEKGFAMAIVKKICGNTYDYFEMFKEYCNE